MLLSLANAATAHGAATDIIVRKRPASIECLRLPPAQKRTAKTTWFFHCRPNFSFTSTSSAGQPITLKVTSVKIALSLSIETVLPARLSKRLADHEKGHRSICETIYGSADVYAKECAEAMVGTQFKTTCTDLAAAEESAAAQAGQKFCRQYCAKTTIVVNAISDTFDRLTDHSHNKAISSAQAVKEAFVSYQRHPSKE